MLELLKPAAGSPEEDVGACLGFVRAHSPRLFRRLRWLPAELRGELAPVAAWFLAARECAREPGGRGAGFDARRCRAELERIAASAGQARRAESALGRSFRSAALNRALPAEPFRRFLEATERGRHVHAYGTRDELLAQGRGIAVPVGRTLLRFSPLEGERAELLADSCSLACFLADRLRHVRRDRGEGRLFLPVEDLSRYGLSIERAANGPVDDDLRSLMAELVRWARGWLDRGWPITGELGPWRGRLAAVFLRRIELDLRAVQRRGYDVLSRAPRVGPLARSGALLLGLATRRPPRSLRRGLQSSSSPM